jgi:hypothetical protein
MRGYIGTGFAAGFLCLALAGPAAAQAASALTPANTRELIDAAKATAKATQESLDYARVTPDILHQILAKLDKLRQARQSRERRQGAAGETGAVITLLPAAQLLRDHAQRATEQTQGRGSGILLTCLHLERVLVRRGEPSIDGEVMRAEKPPS